MAPSTSFEERTKIPSLTLSERLSVCLVFALKVSFFFNTIQLI